MDGPITVSVECYSGSEYAERPLLVVWQDERIRITRIISDERTPFGKRFKVELEKGQFVELIYSEDVDDWQLSRLT